MSAQSQLFYREEGTGPPILLIHGSGFDAWTWGATYDELSMDHRVIAYNRRGYPGSGGSPTSWEDHAADAAALIPSLGAVPATVVAHSSGAIVAIDLIRSHPHFVESVVLLDPALYVRRYLTADFVRAFVGAQLMRRLRGEERGVEIFLLWATRYPAGRAAWDRSDFPDAWRKRMLANASAIFADMAAGDGSHIPRTILSAIERPVALVKGELSPRMYHKVIGGLIRSTPGAKLTVLAGSGHAMMFDQPLALAKLIRDVTRLPD